MGMHAARCEEAAQILEKGFATSFAYNTSSHDIIII